MAEPDETRPESPSSGQLSQLWRQVQHGDVGEFLAGFADLPVTELVAVLLVEQSKRWQRGERIPAEHYLRRFPSLEDDGEAVVEMAYGEFLLREEYGERPTLDEYLYRFPKHEVRLRQQVELYRALALTDGLSEGARATRDPGEARISGTPVVPGYEILEVLGRGGMGVVYKARQVKADRLVALKMILHRDHASPNDLKRFRTEAVAIARLQHPNIVAIYEVGESQGTPFYSMELCAGGSLDRQLAGTPLEPLNAAALVQVLAQAMHCAHQANVIHRDLKPGNVLFQEEGTTNHTLESRRVGRVFETHQRGQVGLEDSTHPTAIGVIRGSSLLPKITDFGLAKKLDDVGQTASGAIMGTPSHMAPEQASGNTSAIGPATDVYALGAILYECLTGRPPFKAATPLDTIFQVLREEPVAVRQLNTATPADLETICHKCLRKEPVRRYATAGELADDLGRYLRGEPIVARPVLGVERAIKWVRRNPVVAALTGAVALVLLAGVTASSYFAISARAEAGRADEKAVLSDEQKELAEAKSRAAEFEALRANTARHAIQIDLALRAWRDRDIVRAEEILAEIRPVYRENWETRHVRSLCRRTALSLLGHTGPVTSVAISSDGTRIVSASLGSDLFDPGKPGEVKVWDAATGQEKLFLKGLTSPVTSVAISLDGKYIVSGNSDNTVKVWDAATGKERLLLTGHTDWVTSVAISSDSTRIVSGSGDKRVKVWDVATGKEKLSLTGHDGWVTCVAISQDAKRIVSGSYDKTVKVWDAGTGKELHSLEGHDDWVSCVAMSSDGKRIVSGSYDNTVKVWDTATGEELLSFEGHNGAVLSLAISRDGTRIVSISRDKTVKVWDAATGQEVLSLKGHTREISSVAISGDGNRIVSGSADKTVRVWNTAAGQELHTIEAHSETVSSVAISRDGTRIVSGSADNSLNVWDTATMQKKCTLKGHTDYVADVAISRDGTRIVSGSLDKTVKVWDAATGENKCTLKGHTDGVNCVAISQDNSHIVSGSDDHTVRVWDAATGKEKFSLMGHTEGVNCVAISRDATRIVSASEDKTVKVWDAATGREMLSLEGHTREISSVAISTNGMRIVSGSADKTVKVWDAATGKELLSLRGHTDPVTSVAISPDGTRIFSGSDDSSVKVWDAASGQEMLTLKGHTDRVTSVAISHDATRIVSGSADNTVKVWAAPAAKP